MIKNLLQSLQLISGRLNLPSTGLRIDNIRYRPTGTIDPGTDRYFHDFGTLQALIFDYPVLINELFIN
jgi:hypothetical protein